MNLAGGIDKAETDGSFFHQIPVPFFADPQFLLDLLVFRHIDNGSPDPHGLLVADNGVGKNNGREGAAVFPHQGEFG